MISISVISHGHGQMVSNVVSQLLKFQEVSEIFVTKNIPEELYLPQSDKIILIENVVPTGFGHNHNYVFNLIKSSYFCPLNPDVIFDVNPFPALLQSASIFEADLVAPLILNSMGNVEDSARNFPSLLSLMNKFIGGASCGNESFTSEEILYPDWIAGMFMLFRADTFRFLRGFDERYFLYYEDVDICTRLWANGFKLLVNSSVGIIHDARRTSHSSARYASWHLASMIRYFLTHWGRLPTKKL